MGDGLNCAAGGAPVLGPTRVSYVLMLMAGFMTRTAAPAVCASAQPWITSLRVRAAATHLGLQLVDVPRTEQELTVQVTGLDGVHVGHVHLKEPPRSKHRQRPRVCVMSSLFDEPARWLRRQRPSWPSS